MSEDNIRNQLEERLTRLRGAANGANGANGVRSERVDRANAPTRSERVDPRLRRGEPMYRDVYRPGEVFRPRERHIEAGSDMRVYLLRSAQAADDLLKRQIRICEQSISRLIETQSSSDNEDGQTVSDDDATSNAVNDRETRVARIVAKVDELNLNRDTLKVFMAQSHVDRDMLKNVFDIIRHAYEYDLAHPQPILEERLPSRSAEPPNANANARGRSLSEMLTSMIGRPSEGIEIGTFHLGGNADNAGSNAAMRGFLQRMGAPSSFWENIPVPINDQTLEKIPSQTYQSVTEARAAKSERECNKECNICMMAFDNDDMVRVFPCCNLAQHTECLVEWFKTHDTCVVCRKKIAELTGTDTERQIPTEESSESSENRIGDSFMTALMLSALMGSTRPITGSTAGGFLSVHSNRRPGGTGTGGTTGTERTGGTTRTEGTTGGTTEGTGGTTNRGTCPCGRDHSQDLVDAIDRYSNSAHPITDDDEDVSSCEHSDCAEPD